MFTFSEMLALVESESSFGAYVCHRRPGGLGATATCDLVRCKCVCVCVCVCHRGHYGGGGGAEQMSACV